MENWLPSKALDFKWTRQFRRTTFWHGCKLAHQTRYSWDEHGERKQTWYTEVLRACLIPFLTPAVWEPPKHIAATEVQEPSLSWENLSPNAKVFYIALNRLHYELLWSYVAGPTYFSFSSHDVPLFDNKNTEFKWWSYRLYGSSNWEDAVRTSSARCPVTFVAPGAQGWTAAAFKNRTGIATEDLEAGINVMSKVFAWEFKIGKI